MIQGLSHITLLVEDLKKSERIIVEVLGGKQIYASGEKKEVGRYSDIRFLSQCYGFLRFVLVVENCSHGDSPLCR